MSAARCTSSADNRQNDEANRSKLLDEFRRTRAKVEECASMNGRVCLAIRTHEGDAATGEANGRGAAGKVMEPARVREGRMEDAPGGQAVSSRNGQRCLKFCGHLWDRPQPLLLAHPIPPQEKVTLFLKLYCNGFAQPIQVFGAREMFMGGFG